MRMRKKPNLVPRVERCASTLVSSPEALRGRWALTYPGFRALHLELGCGKGRFTAETALREPDVLLLALEKVPDALVVAMERVFDGGIPNVRFLCLDAAGLPEIFAPGEVSRLYINFPDPWPKTKQYKRRLTAPAFLDIYRRLLPPGGEVWFKTDNLPLFEWSLEQFETGGWTLREVTTDLHAQGPVGVMTDYEAKFHSLGVPIKRLVAVRTEGSPCASSHGTSTACGPV
jgi:tRNA (guanine-N7-)-methyltransferase